MSLLVEGLGGSVAAVAIGPEFVGAEHSQVAPLVDVHDELLARNTHGVQELIVDQVNQLLDPVLGETLSH
jgi:hypothetical protein